MRKRVNNEQDNMIPDWFVEMFAEEYPPYTNANDFFDSWRKRQPKGKMDADKALIILSSDLSFEAKIQILCDVYISGFTSNNKEQIFDILHKMLNDSNSSSFFYSLVLIKIKYCNIDYENIH